jgi:hypothetical protein
MSPDLKFIQWFHRQQLLTEEERYGTEAWVGGMLHLVPPWSSTEQLFGGSH